MTTYREKVTGSIVDAGRVKDVFGEDETPRALMIQTPEGRMKANPGDWVTLHRDEDDPKMCGYWVWTPQEFKEHFEEVVTDVASTACDSAAPDRAGGV